MSEVQLFNEQKITAYDEFTGQLAELRAANDKAVFDYKDVKGNKEARSHVFKLRKTKTAVDKVRKTQKQASLEYGRRVDSQAKEIVTRIDEMIEVHQSPLDEIEQIEKDRITKHEFDIAELQTMLDQIYTGESLAALKKGLEYLKSIEPDESFEEFTAPALSLFKKGVAQFEELIIAEEKREAEAAELERLRKEQEQREQKERETRIAKEAEERATKAAEQKAEQDRINAELEAKKREDDLKAKAQAAEQAKLTAERLAKEATENERKRIEQERLDQEAEAKKREQDKAHHKSINNAALDAIVKAGASKVIAKSIVEAIAKGLIPNVTISY